MLLVFDEFTFDRDAGILQRGQRRVPLEPRPARLLACLLERRGELVSREELFERLWDPGTHVDYSEGLNYCVRQVRLALGDEARSPRFIETLSRRGYRFLAPVKRGDPELRGPSPRRIRRLWMGLALAASLAMLVTRLVDAIHDALWGD